MRLQELSRRLSKVAPFASPRADLEQYVTPPDHAARILFEAWSLGDIEGRRVLDLGCGTGIFAIGAALLRATSAVGVDVDPRAIEAARTNARALDTPQVEFRVSDVQAVDETADTVIMNPPFGAQTLGADRPFLAAAARAAPVVYSLHNNGTREFLHDAARGLGRVVTHEWKLLFPLAHTMRHHDKPVREVEVVLVRMVC
ncbi:MAG: METTL5 family protein [Methanobacteriota archaeon]